MTQYVYIASPMKLPVGSFGDKPISADKPNVYESELDFTSLYFENNYDDERKTRFSYSSHFSFKHQVSVASNYIPLAHELHRKRHKSTIPFEDKCMKLLYSYLEEAIHASGRIEYFTSLNGQEKLPLSNKKSVHWNEIKDPYDLVLNDLELWEMTIY